MSPIVFINMHKKRKSKDIFTLKALLDSGATATLVNSKFVKHLRRHKCKTATWTTQNGEFTTSSKAKIEFLIPELNDQRFVKAYVHDTPQDMSYDIIIGQDLMQEMGIDILNSTKTIKWDEQEINMRPRSTTVTEMLQATNDPPAIQAEIKRIGEILDAKYELANLKQVTKDIPLISKSDREAIYRVLKKYEILFDGQLGRYTGPPHTIHLKDGATPYHGKPYKIPQIYEAQLKAEVERLVKIGVLKRVNHSEWGTPCFIIPKKDQTVRFLSDLRELNKRIKRFPYPIPNIQDLLMKLEGFQWATTLDLNMGYYHIQLCPASKRVCTIVLPCEKYEYQVLPMGLSNSPDIFQENMSNLFRDLEYVREYIDDLLVTSSGTFEDYLEKVDEVLKRLKDVGLRVNANKSKFCRTEVEYLGYLITREGIKPQAKKVQALHNMATPRTRKELRSFLGLVNYYRDMTIRRSHIIAPLTKLTSKKVPFVWTEVHQKAFEQIKMVLSEETLLRYPDFSKEFEIHTDASKSQIGAVIVQEGQPIAFYSRRLTDCQTRYTTTERELLAIVETLKEFRNILLGQQITIHTDHKNLTYANFNTDRVIRWRLIIEEYGPNLKYIEGPKNVVADALSRLGLKDNPEFQDMLEQCNFYENQILTIEGPELQKKCKYYMNEIMQTSQTPIIKTMPIDLEIIKQHQDTEKCVEKMLNKDKRFHVKNFRRAGFSQTNGTEINLLCYSDRIVVPKVLQPKILEWYHYLLVHPGRDRTLKSISQHFYLKGMTKDVERFCKRCPICQTTKINKKKYGLLPPKEAEVEPWHQLCVDLIGPYKIPIKNM